jgi:hypothetical protein
MTHAIDPDVALLVPDSSGGTGRADVRDFLIEQLHPWIDGGGRVVGPAEDIAAVLVNALAARGDVLRTLLLVDYH